MPSRPALLQNRRGGAAGWRLSVCDTSPRGWQCELAGSVECELAVGAGSVNSQCGVWAGSVSWLAVWSVSWQCSDLWQSAADDAPIEIERELFELGADVAATTEAVRVEALRRMRP